MKIGAHYLGDGNCEFRVWAPNAAKVTVKIVSPQEQLLSMQQEGGYWQVTANNIHPGNALFLPIK